MKKYEVFFREDVKADSPEQAAEIACGNLKDAKPSKYTVLETKSHTFWNVDLKAKEGKQSNIIVVLNKRKAGKNVRYRKNL